MDHRDRLARRPLREIVNEDSSSDEEKEPMSAKDELKAIRKEVYNFLNNISSSSSSDEEDEGYFSMLRDQSTPQRKPIEPIKPSFSKERTQVVVVLVAFLIVLMLPIAFHLIPFDEMSSFLITPTNQETTSSSTELELDAIIRRASLKATNNWISARLNKVFYDSLMGISLDNPMKPIDFLELEVAEQTLFRELKKKLETDRNATILDVHKLLSGRLAMVLHSFCNESKASLPMSSIFMTIENESGELAANETPELLAAGLLNQAWGHELGEDKVSSLISRVSVNVVKVIPEVRNNHCED